MTEKDLGDQVALHQAYLDTRARYQQLVSSGTGKSEIQTARLAVDRARDLWQRAAQKQRNKRTDRH